MLLALLVGLSLSKRAGRQYSRNALRVWPPRDSDSSITENAHRVWPPRHRHHRNAHRVWPPRDELAENSDDYKNSHRVRPTPKNDELGYRRVSASGDIHGSLLDETFDEELEHTVNKGLRRRYNSRVQAPSRQRRSTRPDLEMLMQQKLADTERRYSAIANAVRAILDMNGVRYLEQGSELQKNFEAMIEELIEPKV